jgi:DNA-binding transcriptional LysR family regulator
MESKTSDQKYDLKIRALKTFLILAETGSFSKTAEKLDITQGTVSNHITSLENYFGKTELFHKGERAREGERLTQAGMMVLEIAREIVELLDNTKVEVERLKGAIAGTLKIATSTIPGEHILPKFIAMFKAKYPTVEFEMDLSDSGKSLEKLLAKETDLAAVGSLIGYEAEVDTFSIAEEQLVLIAPLDHDLQSETAVDPKILVDSQFITREKTSGTRTETEKILKSLGISLKEFKSTLELGSTEAVITAVSEGYGISVISSIAAEKAENYIKIIPLKSVENNARNLFMVRRIQESYPVLVETFWAFVKKSLNKNE